MNITHITKRKTAVAGVWAVFGGNTKIGTVRTKQLSPSQRTWSGTFNIPLEDGTKAKIKVAAMHTANQVNKQMCSDFNALKVKPAFKPSEACVAVRKAKAAE